MAQGIVSRRVCFHWSSDCCHWYRYIRVRNCGAFYVYELSRPPTCNLRYCGDREEGEVIQIFVLMFVISLRSPMLSM